jgi:periplasmic protein TonB
MTEEEQEEVLEKKNRRVAAFSTAGIQGALFLMMLLIVAWRAPDPPMPEYGVELNFGLDSEGYGEIQPETPVGNEGTEAEDPAPVQQEEVKPEVKKEEVVPEKVEPEPVDTKVDDDAVVSEEESPVVVKEKKKEPEKPIEKPIEKPKEKVEEKKVVEQPKVTPKVDSKAVFKPDQPATSGTGDGKEGAKAGQPGNHGDDPGTTGDKGNPQGTLDAKALYGTPGGGGGGVGISGFNGFEWPKVQTPTLPDEAYGVYEFIVKVDADGTVVKVTPVRSGLSREAQQRLKDMIQQLEFIPKGANLPAESEGRITFRVVSR